ncbi:MAG: DUF4159 domain-containing protein [Pirellulales bacterium]
MRWPKRLLCLSLVVTICVVSNMRVARAEVTAEQVRQKIDRAISYLRLREDGRGHWHEGTIASTYHGGITALCTLALLESGVPPDDPLIRRALTFLRNVQTQKVYVRSLQVMVFCRAAQTIDRARIKDIVRWLESVQIGHDKNAGGWGYPYSLDGGRNEANPYADPSCTQFAMLALHEAEQAGFEVRPQTWTEAIKYWSRKQNVGGAWQYRDGFSSGSMTCAGVASLIIARGRQNIGDATVEGTGCVCGSTADNNEIEKGIRWLGKHFSITRNPGENRWHYYYLYCLERVGRLTARRFFYRNEKLANGETETVRYDWYREGAAYLVRTANDDGSWISENGAGKIPEIATSFALLFLSKGRRPVLISKLKRANNDWNRLQNDLTNLTRYTERKWKLPMTWQVIDLERSTADDFIQTPVLFISGSQDFTLTAAQRRELRRYVEQGGFIFADQCCGGTRFDKQFKEAMREVFPEKGYELKKLDAQHPIWSIDERVDPALLDSRSDNGRWLWGVDFACKTSVVYCPANLSCYWALDSLRAANTYPQEVRAQIKTCRAIGVNVLAYATNRKLKPKDAIPTTLAGARAQGTGQRGHFAIAKLRHAGGCDAAPRAMVNLMDAVATALDIHTAANPRLVSLSDEALFDYSFVYMHGRYDFRLSAKEKQRLKTFVERGGTIMADAICASPSFAKAFRREMRETFGQPLDRIPTGHAIFTSDYGGIDLSQVTRRDSFRARPGGPVEIKERRGSPEIEGLKIDGRYCVTFSPLDLSCALEKHVSAHCRGYTPEDAARIAINVILYSLHE